MQAHFLDHSLAHTVCTDSSVLLGEAREKPEARLSWGVQDAVGRALSGASCGDSSRGVRGVLFPVYPGREVSAAVLHHLEGGGLMCVGQGHPQSSGSAPQPCWGVPLPGRGRPSAGGGAHVQPGVPGDPPWASQAMPSSPERWVLGGEACESAGKCENGFNGDLDPDGRRAGGNAKRQVIRVQGCS